MKKLFQILAFAAILVSCSKDETVPVQGTYTLTGYTNVETKTDFGTPTGNTIPFEWSAEDKIWSNGEQSQAAEIDANTGKAVFSFINAPGTDVYYNMTGSSNQANVPAEQNIANNLGDNGDFGYAQVVNGSFTLNHATAYLWFDVTSSIANATLEWVKVDAADVDIAGKAIWNGTAFGSVIEGSKSITLTVGQALAATNSNVWAMVVMPTDLTSKDIQITYKLKIAGADKYYSQNLQGKNLERGMTYKISTAIANDEVYGELRVLDFEGDYWDSMIDDKPFMGNLLYGGGDFSWYDSDNTSLCHIQPECGYGYFWSGGHAISNYSEISYHPDDLISYVEKYHGYYDGYEGWQFLQLLTPIGARSGDNFAVHFGYIDGVNSSMTLELPALQFEDEEARVIDHMYVTNTNYVLNQVIYGVSREDDLGGGDQFGGNYNGLSDNTFLKIVAYGYENVDDTDYNSSVSFYLVEQGKKVVLDWKKWDLSGLGKVAKVEFNFEYSSDMGGDYGFTIPAYFAYDDVAVRF